MSATPQGPDWWQASDGQWYPPPRPDAPNAPAGGPPAAAQATPVNRTAIIVAVGALLTAAAVGVAVARLGGDDGESGDPPPSTEAPPAVTDPDDERPPSTPSTSGGPTSTTEAGSAGIEGIDVADSGFSTYEGFGGQAGSYGLILENTTGEPITNFTVEVVVYDTTDAVVTSDPHAVAVVNPGSRLGLGAEIADALPNGIGRLDIRLEAGTGGPAPAGTFTISDVSTTSDEFGIYTTFVVSSSYDVELELPFAYAVYRDAAGRIIGGANGFVDLIPPRGRANGEVASFTVVPNVTEAEVYVDPGFF